MMKVVFHEDFFRSYTMDPAAATGRIEAVVKVIRDKVTFVQAIPAVDEDIAAVHTKSHIAEVTREGLYDIAALAAGGAIQAAEIGLKEPCFGLIRLLRAITPLQTAPGDSASSATWPLL